MAQEIDPKTNSMEPTKVHGASEPGETERPVKKCKGGRKLIYATLEQRKQRNRDAQAAFRERRTEHIQELETTVQEQKAKLQASQAAHTSAKDECLLLRYKNSLLERILLEKGIDVNAELNRKFEVGPGRVKSAIKGQAASQRPETISTTVKKVSPKPNPPNTVLPLSPSASSCCTHCTASHAHSSPESHPTPPSAGSSPQFAPRSIGVGAKPPSPTASTAYGHPNKRRRHAYTTTCGPNSACSNEAAVQKYNSAYRVFSYPQAAAYALGKYIPLLLQYRPAWKNSTESVSTDPESSLDAAPTIATVEEGNPDADMVAAKAQSAFASYVPRYQHHLPPPPPQHQHQQQHQHHNHHLHHHQHQHQQQPYFSSKTQMLDFERGPITQLMDTYDENFDLDLEFLSSLQA
ncbi:hypothetical protein BP6252_05548 [Coleophoma cylindrospora]|uniref:BZIP domain-containing protein n=1 Tax=Coleophoma cylindrospora TaxID=1849047 RepID=A0A3D8RU15_9HELO|nr:hypothetical protein BP6252_05548 [Coleophoma cylindrospora]